ncbi:MAG: insulinase family protein [Bauldia sp.]
MTAQPFRLLREQKLDEVNSVARLYRHEKTGAEVLSLINDDENKVFGITFRTPPSDSTGVAHILEHSVLCGSRKYPVKEPFVELMKGSLHTFLNAMTYPDKTTYPVASQNVQDFYNLVDVYLDAVFHPRLTEDIFRQEGWHYEVDGESKALTFKGVVFNEMKGAYSSPDAVLNEVSQRSLYPDITYGVDSGGDPKHITDLTFTQLKGFHEKFYHPSNARAFFYGDDDPEKRLAILDEYLSAFPPVDPRSSVAKQKRFSSPKRIAKTYAAGEQKPGAGSAMVTVNWMLDEPADAEATLALHVLEYALYGTPASPLRKALIDSGLGEAPVGGGLEDELRQPMFSVGLKGVKEADVDKVEKLILDTFARLAKDGIDALTVESAVNTIEFRLRENNTGSFPRGIALMLRSLRSWLHEGDPLAPLAFSAPLAAVKASLAGGKRPLEAAIKKHFLDNTHRTTVVLTPDSGQEEREAEEEKARLAATRKGMSDADLKAAAATAEELHRRQAAPDNPADLAKIPTLRLGDLPRQNKHLPIALDSHNGSTIAYHELATNGVIYLDLGFDLHRVPGDLLPYVTLLCRALVETGAGRDDFVALSQKIGAKTGGISPTRWTSAKVDAKGSVAQMLVRSKATPDRAGDLIGLLRQVLLEPRLDNRERIEQLILEDRAGFEGRIAPMGMRIVDLRLRSSLHEADWAAEQMGGISYLFFLRRLSEQVKSDWPAVRAALEKTRNALVNRSALVANVTTDGGTWRAFRPQLTALIDALPATSPSATWTTLERPRSEGLTIPAPVNYVGKGADLFALGRKLSGAAAAVGLKHLNTGWLWDKVRVQGGAYGARSAYDRFTGGLTLLSYRDPNLLGTLDVYDQAAEFLRHEVAEAEMTRSVIGAIGEVDQYMLPDAKGLVSMQRHLRGDSEEARQRIRDSILSASARDFAELADALVEVAKHGHVVVVGGEAAIGAANAERQGFLAVEKVL